MERLTMDFQYMLENYSKQIGSLAERMEHDFFTSSDVRMAPDNIQKLVWQFEKLMRDVRATQELFVQHLLVEGYGHALYQYGGDLPPASIDELNGIYRIRFDALLPLKTKTACNLICEDLHRTIESYFNEHQLQVPVMKKAVVVFCHHVEKGFKGQLRDYDNMERKCVLDTLIPWFLPDDSPECIRSFDMLKRSGSTYTEILLMNWDSFREKVRRDPF